MTEHGAGSDGPDARAGDERRRGRPAEPGGGRVHGDHPLLRGHAPEDEDADRIHPAAGPGRGSRRHPGRRQQAEPVHLAHPLRQPDRRGLGGLPEQARRPHRSRAREGALRGHVHARLDPPGLHARLRRGGPLVQARRPLRAVRPGRRPGALRPGQGPELPLGHM
ncbi:hypothetical protein LSPH26S_02215 [Lysinibacillus sphaericus]